MGNNQSQLNRLRHTYIICATPRSGSTLLCDLLTDTGVAGQPDSFFMFDTFDWPQYFDISIADWNHHSEFDRSYLSAVMNYGANGTSVFGMRLMWESLAELSARLDWFYPNLVNDSARFQAAFGKPVYLHLSRDDKVAQAVSRLKAEQSGLWFIFSDGSERERLKPAQSPGYDFNRLNDCAMQAEADDAAWSTWFTQQQINPIHFSYEALCDQPGAILEVILSNLGLDPGLAKTVAPRTAKLADSESCEWIARFKAEQLARI